jgi:hypothetical protein
MGIDERLMVLTDNQSSGESSLGQNPVQSGKGNAELTEIRTT